MSADYLDKLDHVKISRGDNPDVPEDLTVIPMWKGVDRPHGTGWGISTRKPQLAERLKKAIESGRFYKEVRVATDNAGRTYMATDHPVVGRRMAADLAALGF